MHYFCIAIILINSQLLLGWGSAQGYLGYSELFVVAINFNAQLVYLAKIERSSFCSRQSYRHRWSFHLILFWLHTVLAYLAPSLGFTKLNLFWSLCHRPPVVWINRELLVGLVNTGGLRSCPGPWSFFCVLYVVTLAQKPRVLHIWF